VVHEQRGRDSTYLQPCCFSREQASGIRAQDTEMETVRVDVVADPSGNALELTPPQEQPTHR